MKKVTVGTVYITLEDVLVRTTSGLSAELDCSFLESSLAFGI
jgi:hypothetical protein